MAARILVPAGFSMRSSSRPSTVQVTSPEPTESTTYQLASLPVAHQPFKSPRQSPHTSGIHSASGHYRGRCNTDSLIRGFIAADWGLGCCADLQGFGSVTLTATIWLLR